jgi:hypothetical protein
VKGVEAADHPGAYLLAVSHLDIGTREEEAARVHDKGPDFPQ